jgi:hypothetical protein
MFCVPQNRDKIYFPIKVEFVKPYFMRKTTAFVGVLA